MPKRKRKPQPDHIWWKLGYTILIVAFFIHVVEVVERAPTTGDETAGQKMATISVPGEYGEFIAAGEPQTAFISGYINGEPFENKEVQYVMVGGLPIFEGDIILHLDDSLTLGGLGHSDREFYWPGGIVPYEIDPGLPAQYRVEQAIAHWEEHTSIRFVKRTSSNKDQYPNFVVFKPSFGCSSYVGMIGGPQPINLGIGCSTGNTIHEIGHAIGLWHEHSRADRDEHVAIHYENIQPGMEFNFNKRISDGEDIGPYDYGSIMHYPRWAFSKNGKDTIVPHGDEMIGQRSSLSPGDIAAVEHMYGSHDD